MLDRPLEHDYWDQNQSVLGMDEAGRGPIAGPLMVAGVIFPKVYPTCGFSQVIKPHLFSRISLTKLNIKRFSSISPFNK